MRRAVMFASLQGLILCALLLVRPPVVAPTYLAASRDKHERLRTAPAPRLILVGGSSVAFGSDSARLARRFDRAAVNMGLHAALGVELALREVQDEVRAGDWVVVSLEYHRLARPESIDPLVLWHLLRARPETLGSCGAAEARVLLDEGFTLLRTAVGRRVLPQAPEAVGDLYRREAFDEVGDFVAHLDRPSRDVTGERLSRPGPLDDCAATIDALAAFSASVAARGGRAFYAFPPVPEEVYRADRAGLDAVAARFSRALPVPVVLGAAEAVLPADCFFDTLYHLNRRGRDRRTDALIEGLARAAR